MGVLTVSNWASDVSGFWNFGPWTNGVPNSTTVVARLGLFTQFYTVSSTTNVTVAALVDSNSGILDLKGGLFDIFNSTTINVAQHQGANSVGVIQGLVYIEASATFALGVNANATIYDTASLVGTGTLWVKGGNVEFGAPITTLAVGDIVLQPGSVMSSVYSGAVVNNESFIQGAGTIGSSTAMTFDNRASGTIDATGQFGSTLTLNAAAAAFKNEGLIESTGGALVIEGVLVNNGAIRALSGSITLKNGWIYGNGLIDVGPQGKFILNNGFIQSLGRIAIGTPGNSGGVLTTTAGNITVATLPSTQADGLDGPTLNFGAIDIVANSVLNVEGFVDQMQTGAMINLQASGAKFAELAIMNSFALVDGVLAMSNSANNFIASDGANAIFINRSTIVGAGVIGDGYLQLLNGGDGVIDANTATGIVINGAARGPAGSDVNAGVIEATGSGLLTINGALLNDGVLLASGYGTLVLDDTQITGAGRIATAGSGVIDLADGTSIGGSGIIRIANGGALTTIGANSDETLQVNVIDQGTFTVASNTTIDVGGYFVMSGGGVANINGAVNVSSLQTWDLLGWGTMTLGPNASITTHADEPATFINNGLTMVGAGFLGGDWLTFVNGEAGTIDATGAMTLDSSVHGDGPDQNLGVLESTAGGVLTIYNPFDNENSLIANGGKIIDHGYVGLAGVYGTGHIVLENGGVVELDSPTTNHIFFGGGGGGTLVLDSSGIVGSDISIFGASMTVNEKALAYSQNDSLTVTATNTGYLLAVQGAGFSDSFNVISNFASGTFSLQADTVNGGTDIIFTPTGPAHHAAVS